MWVGGGGEEEEDITRPPRCMKGIYYKGLMKCIYYEGLMKCIYYKGLMKGINYEGLIYTKTHCIRRCIIYESVYIIHKSISYM